MSDSLYKQVSDNVTVIYVEGCIGEGKTTVCKALKRALEARSDCRVFYFEEEVDHVMLQEFYKDPKTMEKVFQVQMIVSRIKQKLRASSKTEEELQLSDKKIYIIIDTGYMSDEAFITTNMVLGHICGQEYTKLLEIQKELEQSVLPMIMKPNHVILLYSNADKCMENIRLRGRPAESNMDRNYIETLLNVYKRLFTTRSQRITGIQHHLVDTSDQYANVESILELVMDEKDIMSHSC